MSEETTTATTDAPPDDAAVPDEAPASEAVAAEESPKKLRWAHRSTGGQTYLDRYVFPALVPLISVAIIVFYVVNLSRVFLSGKGTIAIVAAVAVTIAILVVSSAISQATHMRTQSLAVLTAVSLLIVAFAGWIAVGHAQEKKAAEVAACKPITATATVVVPASVLKFDKSSYTVKAGCVAIVYGGAPGHTLAFDPPGPTGPTLASSGGSTGPAKFAWTLKKGNYIFYCTVPGHRTSGMQATLVVK